MTASYSALIESIASTYVTDTIIILGKGASADLVDPSVLSGSLVIGINDAERIFPADITVMNGEWVLHGLTRSGFRSSLYLAPWDFDARGQAVEILPHVRLTHDSADMMMNRMMGDELVIEDVLFITALNVARNVAAGRGRRQAVYMVGFDFDAAAGYSRHLDVDFAPGGDDQRTLQISPQEHYFLHALYMLRESDLELSHVGRKSFSSLTPEDLNSRHAQRGGGARDGEAHVVEMVAELTTNHFGDRTRLERMIRSSKAAGADYVKLQKREVESFYTPDQLSSPYHSPFGETFGDYRRQLELSESDFEFVSRLCDGLGIGWFVSALDPPSFDFVQAFSPAMVKLPSTISEHVDYLRYVSSRYSGKVVVSTGMTDVSYEAFILESFAHCDRLYLLQCTSAYPTPMADCNIAVVAHYSSLTSDSPNVVPGFSSHDHGWIGSALAVAAGARMIEKHVKLGDTEWAHFDAVAVDLLTDEFRDYVRHIREAEVMMGSAMKELNPSEHHKYVRAPTSSTGDV